MQHLTIVLRAVQALYQRSLDFVKAESYDFLNVEVREFTFNRCPFQKAGQMMTPDREPCRGVSCPGIDP
jgi:hypothetical protein